MEDEDDGDCGDFGQVCTHYFDLLTVWREEIEGEAATEGLCVPDPGSYTHVTLPTIDFV